MSRSWCLVAAALVIAPLAVSASARPGEPVGTLVFSSTRTENLHGEIVVVDPARPGRRLNLSRHPAADRDAAVSPNGRMIAFVSERGGGQALWTMTTAGRQLTRITKRYRMIDTAAWVHAPRWSPDGTRLLYEVASGGVTTFFVVPAQGGSEQAIARGIDVAWAPDSRRVAVTEPLSGGGTEAGVSVRDLRGRVLSRRAGFLVGWSARGDLATTWRGRIFVERANGSRTVVRGDPLGPWSPDGRRLAFVRGDGIWLLGTSGAPRRIAKRRVGSWLGWAPDGRSFLYHDGRGTAMLLAVGGRPRRLAHVAVGAFWSWSRDGRIAFGSRSLFVTRPGAQPRLLDRGTGGACFMRFESIAWLADGRVLVVRGHGGGHQADLWRSDGSGSAPRRFLGDADHWESAPVWSPDGDRVVYERGLPHTREGACAGISEPSLWIARADGRGARRLVNDERHDDFAPVWSPDGSRVAFLRASLPGGPVLGIHLVEVASGRVHQVTHSSSDGVPSWSPNGQQLAFSRARRILVVRADGTGMRRLVAGDTPAWSPRGSLIAYLRRGRVWTVAPDGSGARPLAPAIDPPVWSPDGRRIAVTTGGRLAVVTPGGMERTIVRGRDIRGVSWAPNGRWLSYVATAPPDGHSELFRVAAAGGRPTQLTRDLARLGRATWRPS